MKKERGITLIALVITIIVLLILAGITLATLFGNNGILTQSQLAVEANKEANAKEQVQMAWTACETEYQAAWTKDSSVQKDNYFKKENLNKNLGTGTVDRVEYLENEKIIVTYKDDDGTEYEFEIENGQVYVAGERPDMTDITLSADTINMQVGEAKILTAKKVPADADDTLVFTSEQPTIATVDAASGEIKGISAGQTTITVKGTNKPEITKQCTVTVENPPVVIKYLVDTAEIGDYIDIGISYSNTDSFNASAVVGSYPSTGMTGWRVLNKTGSGESGTVTLVAAGCPLMFCHIPRKSNEAIPMLEDLKKEITIVSSWAQGFTKNGFTGGNNLKSIFEGCNYIDTNKSIHALGCSTNYNEGIGTTTSAYSPLNEIETTYEALTGSRKTMRELNSMTLPLKTENMQSVNPSLKAIDLLGNGFWCWLGGASYDDEKLWLVGNSGASYGYDHDEFGIRPVITLKSGVKVADSNTGDGASENTAYDISL